VDSLELVKNPQGEWRRRQGGPWPDELELSNAQMLAVIADHQLWVFTRHYDGVPAGPPLQRYLYLRIRLGQDDVLYRVSETLPEGAVLQRIDDKVATEEEDTLLLHDQVMASRVHNQPEPEA